MFLGLLSLLYFISILLCLSSYLFYPIIIYFATKIISFSTRKADNFPPVSIVISAYNEAKDIEEKIYNTLSLDYPKEKLEILVGSDGSNDDTAARVSKFPADMIRFYNFKENRGKTSVQNELVSNANHDIIIFTDAASLLEKDAIKNIVRNFADDRIGCVAGRMKFINVDENITTQSQGLYWRYESKIRTLESALGSLIGVDGPLYAVKKPYYVSLPPNIISDLMTPLLVLAQGKKTILELDAIVTEKPKGEPGQEFDTRRRITLRGMVGIFRYPELLNPLRYPLVSLQIFLHKIFRWFVGYFVLVNVSTCIGLAFYDSLFLMIFILYSIFFIAAYLGWLASNMGFKSKILSIPYYFCLVNVAASLGILDFVRGKQSITWDTVR